MTRSAPLPVIVDGARYEVFNLAMKNICVALLILVLASPTWGREFPRGMNAAGAAEWYRKAAEQGDVSAQYNLGLLYSSGGRGLARDHVEAGKWYRKAADQGDARAQVALGGMYYHGKGVPQDHVQAVKWYHEAAGQGNTSALGALGIMYANGQGVPQSDAEALKWYRKAAEQGHAGAQNLLGELYHRGDGVPQDDAEALQWYRKAGEQGNAKAQYNIGDLYSSGGRNVVQDYAEAAEWFREAADQGHAEAQVRLGKMYKYGDGVSKDYVEAIKWWHEAGKQGYPDALFILGNEAYECGENLSWMCGTARRTQPEYTAAARWYRLAAERGHFRAQFAVGKMYMKGLGVPQDYVLAHMWFNLAAAQAAGSPEDRVPHRKAPATLYGMASALVEASEGRGSIVEARDAVVAKMTPDQIAEAQRLAREWKPQNEPIGNDANLWDRAPRQGLWTIR